MSNPYPSIKPTTTIIHQFNNQHPRILLFSIKDKEKKIFDLVASAASDLNVPAYVVGGYVRDRLLARPSKDLDIVCVGDGIQLAQQVASKLSPRPSVVVYQRFGTAMLRHGDIEVEFVGARKESYSENSRKPAVEEGTLQDDQFRRDFTINALAVSLNEENFGEILDPFNGMLHLEEKSIQTPLEPGITFSDDPLRMMRAIRFATQLEFIIHPTTLKAIARYKERIKIVSQERITIELEKIMASKKPSIGFNLLFDTGLLHIIMPEVAKLHGVEVRNRRAHKDNFYHTLEVLDNLCDRSDNIWLRWSALFHDIAKPNTKRFDPKAGWTFHGHEWVGGQHMVPKIFRKMRLPLDSKLDYVQKMVKLHLRPISLTKEQVTDSAVRRLIYDAGEDVEDLLLLCASDITTKNAYKMRRYLEGYEYLKERIAEVDQSDRLRLWQPPIDGNIIMKTFGIKPSRMVGTIKDAVREAILDGDIENEYDLAFQRMLEEGKKLNLEPVEQLG